MAAVPTVVVEDSQPRMVQPDKPGRFDTGNAVAAT